MDLMQQDWKPEFIFTKNQLYFIPSISSILPVKSNMSPLFTVNLTEGLIAILFGFSYLMALTLALYLFKGLSCPRLLPTNFFDAAPPTIE